MVQQLLVGLPMQVHQTPLLHLVRTPLHCSVCFVHRPDASCKQERGGEVGIQGQRMIAVAASLLLNAQGME